MERGAVARTALCAGLVVACARGGSVTSSGTSPGADGGVAEASGPAAVEPVAAELQAVAREGLLATRKVEESCGSDRAAYLQVRRSLLASMEAWRRSISMAAELAFGPPIAQDEGAGAIGALDRLVGGSDCDRVHRQTKQIASAFRMAEMELGRRGMPASLFAQALSDEAYDLGQAVLESTAYVPDADDAALADVTGLLSGLEIGLPAMGVRATEALAPFGRLHRASTLAEVRDRAELVRATGVLGARIRAVLPAYPRFPPATATETISALTLPRPAAPADPARASLGERLFFDARLSRNAARSCSTCHVPAKAYQDGRVAPVSLVPATTLNRNTPTLLYAPLDATLTWDGRLRTADRQALSVIHTDAEMGLRNDELVRAIHADPSYARGFHEAFGRDVTSDDVGLALSAFEARALVVDRAPIDRFARDGTGLSDDARAGLDVFAGKGRCARCHVPPVFAGTRPPDFTVAIYSALGVPTAPGSRDLDPDLGRGAISHLWGDAHAFKVPTLRNVGRTAPYFHHGRYPTLEEVVDFYDAGGGRALGLRVPNQDPDVRPLHLSPEDKRTLLVFMREALDDDR